MNLEEINDEFAGSFSAVKSEMEELMNQFPPFCLSKMATLGHLRENSLNWH